MRPSTRSSCAWVVMSFWCWSIRRARKRWRNSPGISRPISRRRLRALRSAVRCVTPMNRSRRPCVAPMRRSTRHAPPREAAARIQDAEGRSEAFEVPVEDAYAIAVLDVGIVALHHRDVAAIVHADAEAPRRVAVAIVLLDLVPDRAAGHRAADCRRRASVALADRRAEHAAGDRADRSACTDVRVLLTNLLDAGHGAAVAAAFVVVAVARQRAPGADYGGAERHRNERVAQLHEVFLQGQCGG